MQSANTLTLTTLRQGLMSAECVLLEPWYDFRLEVPSQNLGRAMTDIQQMGGRFEPPDAAGDLVTLVGSGPVSALDGYWQSVTAYSRGRGRLSCSLRGYEPCGDAGEVIEAVGYDPERDVENPADSVFCAHGAGFVVKWNEVPQYAHVSSGICLEEEEEIAPPVMRKRGAAMPGSREEEADLQAIFERTYGQVKRRAFQPAARPRRSETQTRTVPPRALGPEYVLVDGYNIIFAWDELKKAALESLERARYMLMDILCNYQGFQKCEVILVFDAYKVKGNPGSVEHYRNIHVVYTKEAETADAYIERATYEIAKEHRVRVATSDNLEQLIILGHGAVRVSAREFLEEVESVEGRIARMIEENNLRGREFRRLENQLKKNKETEKETDRKSVV